ncbi:VCBS repeat domain-containing M23 family metallopeptidase [Nonomuraea wenchangensis]
MPGTLALRLGVAATITACALAAMATPAMANPDLQLPFPCDQKWRLDTWAHAPALDMVKEPDQHGTDGATLVAPAAGTVNQSFYHSNAGNVIQINHGGGYFTTYLHLKSRAVSVGAKVAMGTVIGQVGATGPTSNGHPHLHFELGRDADGSGSATWGYEGSERVRPTFNGVTYGSADNQTWRNVTSRNCPGSTPPPAEPEDATGEAADFDGDGQPDLLGTLSDGELRVYLGTGEPGSPGVTGSGAVIGSGWNPITRISVGDVDNDGKVDLLGRHSDGTLYAFLNASTVGSVNVRNRVTIGSGWNGITRVNMADIDNDGKTDVIGRNSEGVLYAFLNKGTPGAPDITTRVTIGSGWNGITRVNMADIDNDGKVDVIGRNGEGVLYAFLNKGTPGAPDITTRVTIGSGWNGISVVNVVDIDNDGKVDVVGRNSEGALYAFLNKGVPGAPDITTRVTIGSGWNGANRLTVADIDNDDEPDIVARFADGGLNAYLNKGTPGAPDITTRVTIGSGWHIITRLAVIN